VPFSKARVGAIEKSATMSKTPEIRIKVPDVDKLLLLTEAQLKVWLYYKRREGVDKRAWGKASTIAAACGFTNPTSYQSIKNTRRWLVTNGWLMPNGQSRSGLPMFLAVIPRLSLEADNGNLEITPEVIVGLREGKSGDYTEVPTLKEATLKDFAVTSGVSERESEHASSPAAAAAIPPFPPQWNSGLFTDGGYSLLANLYLEEVPTKLYPRCQEIATALNGIAKRYPHTHDQWTQFFVWQKTHKKAALRYRDFDQFMAGHETSLNDYADHNEATCKVCHANRDMRATAVGSYRSNSGQRSILTGDI
jgi:hypothetical protein